MTIAGEQDVPLENKQSVEFLKGIAGVESGVASAGGLIDYVTKRPAAIEAVDLATDHRGTAYGAVDLGHLFGSRKQVGARVNLAGERIASYVNGADGWRAMGAGAADWKLSPNATLNGNFEYQHKVERSAAAISCWAALPCPISARSIHRRCLASSHGLKPNTYDTFNTGRGSTTICRAAGAAFAAASFSHSLIDDNVVYAYGCPIDDSGMCRPSGGDAPDYFFCSRRKLRHLRLSRPRRAAHRRTGRSMVTGHVKTGRSYTRSDWRGRAVPAQRSAAGCAAAERARQCVRTAPCTATSVRKHLSAHRCISRRD